MSDIGADMRSKVGGKHADVITIDEFADILFNKEKQEAFIKKCKELGVVADEPKGADDDND